MSPLRPYGKIDGVTPMKSMEEMMQAAQQAAETIQKQMNDMQVKLDSIEVEGSAGGGLVKVRATAKGRILGVAIDDSLMTRDDKQILEDLVTAAFNDARDRADRVSEQQMREMQGSMGLPPGFNLPGLG
jgi:nucleoid-associated protein EbfC